MTATQTAILACSAALWLALPAALAADAGASQGSSTDPAADAGAAGSPDAASVAATAIHVEGDVKVQAGQDWDAVSEGQLFGPGDRIVTGDGASLHLVLADGSSVALGANSEITLRSLGSGAPGSVTLLSLARGLLDTMVEKLKTGSRFEIETSSAVAAVKGTDFEVSDTGSGGGSAVTVNEGTVQMGDAGRSHFEPVQPGERRRVVQNRVLAAEHLSPEDRDAFRRRWAGAHRLHAQRRGLLARLRRSPRRRAFLRQLRRRRALGGRRPGIGGPGRPRPGLMQGGRLREQHGGQPRRPGLQARRRPAPVRRPKGGRGKPAKKRREQ